MNLRRAGYWSAGILLFLVIAAAIALKALVDPRHIEQLARERAQSSWQRDLKVSALQFDVFPLPTLRIHDLRLDHPTEPPIVAKAVTIDLQLLPLLVGKVRYKNAWFSEATIQYENSPWRIEEALVEADDDLRDVKVMGRIWRDGRAVAVKASVDDLSQLGKAGATSPGRVELDWGRTKLTAVGRIPVDGSMKEYDLQVAVKSDSLEDMNAFFGWKRKPRVPFEAWFGAREKGGTVAITKIALNLGELKLTGDADYTPGEKPFAAIRLATGHLDWARASYDAGNDVAPPPEPPQMFHDTPLAWWMVSGLHGKKGTVDIAFGTLVLRNGVEMKNLKLKAAYDGDRFDITRFESGMLGGTASGRILLDGGRKSVAFDFEGTNLLLERWFKERKSAVRFERGPMRISAKVRASGESMRRLVADLEGPIDIRMGPGVLLNPRAGAAEAKLTGGFGSDGPAKDVNFECVGYALNFRNGKAEGDSIIGARTAESHLLTSGWVDMSAQTVDLRGRLKGTSGGIALSTILGDVRITGPIRAPRMKLDEEARPKAIVRGAAAIATLGLSAVATAAADSREARENDPCDAVFRKR